VSREGSPLREPGQNAVFPADAEQQLHQRIVRLQQVGFVLTLNHIRRFSVQICKELRRQNRGKAEWWERSDLLSEKEPSLNSEENRKSQLWPTEGIFVNYFFKHPRQRSGRYEVEPTTSFNTQCERERI
jgi:hypothetical protein